MHLNPVEEELWTEDLAWVEALIAHRYREKEDGEEVGFSWVVLSLMSRINFNIDVHVKFSFQH